MPHTVGEWRVDASEEIVKVVLEKSGEKMPDGFVWLPVPICRVGEGTGRSREEALANARLIAAAPELLACCERLLDLVCMEPNDAFQLLHQDLIARATTALTTAQGV